MGINEVDEWVRSVSGILERFYPTAAAKATGLPLGAVFRQLVGLTHIGWLELVYEVRCNECNFTLALEHVLDPTELYEKEYSCHICGDDIEVTAENVYPVFFVRAEWSDTLKKTHAANGRKIYPVGGESAPIEQIGLDWIDYVLAPSEIQTLKELVPTVPEVKSALVELEGAIPRDRAEKKDRLRRAKEWGETLHVWVKLYKDAGIGTAVPVAVAKAPEIIAALEKLLHWIAQ